MFLKDNGTLGPNQTEVMIAHSRLDPNNVSIEMYLFHMYDLFQYLTL